MSLTIFFGPARMPDHCRMKCNLQGTISLTETQIQVEGGSRLSTGGGAAITIILGVLFGRHGAGIGSAAANTHRTFLIDPTTSRGHYDDHRKAITLENPTGNSLEGKWLVLRPRFTKGGPTIDEQYAALRTALTTQLGPRFTPRKLDRWTWQMYLIALGGAWVLFSLAMIAYLVISGKAVWVAPKASDFGLD